MLQQLTWTPDAFPHYSGMPHHGEKLHACSSPRPDFNLSPAIIGRPPQSAKRQRSESHERHVKKQKPDVSLATNLHTAQSLQSRPLASAAVAVRHEVEAGSAATTAAAAAAAGASEHSNLDPTSQANSTALSSLPSTSQPTGLNYLHVDQPQGSPAFIDEQVRLPAETAAPEQVKPSTQHDLVSNIQIENRIIDRIESTLNLHTLEKHNELRLIETEMAKCQIMLEQLRRVQVIQYPSRSQSAAAVDNVITGGGQPLRLDVDHAQPSHPAAFGVTDGPYTRHYERWLLQDEAFDPTPRMSRLPPAMPTISGRKRTSLDEQTPVRVPKRSSSSQIPQLPTVTISVDGSPLLVVQRDDGEWVKVVCKICGKQNAANLQGFTNHTRIAHSITYSNHKEAIRDCGQPLDEHEASQVATATAHQLQQQQHQTALLPQATTTTPVRAVKPFVQPLVLSDTTRGSNTGQRSVAGVDAMDWRHSLPPTPVSAVSRSSNGFVPSPDMPHLSKKLAEQGSNIDLRQLVTTSKLRIDLNSVQSLMPEYDSELQTPISASPAGANNRNALQAGSRMPARAPAEEPEAEVKQSTGAVSDFSTPGSLRMHPHHFASRVPNLPGMNAMPGRVSSMAMTGPSNHTHDSSLSHGLPTHSSGTTLDHSPATVDSNPGLISDHEDDSDYVHSSEHGDEMEHDHASSFVKVRGEHGDEDHYMHDYHELADPESQHCTSTASDTNSVFVRSGQNNALSGQSMHEPPNHDNPTHSTTPKKKRGRPRKTDIGPPL